ncbi:MAG: archease [Thermodesulfobacteriota bacterium]
MKQTSPKERRKRKYRQISHTADLGWRIRGESLEEIFANAAAALTATITDRRNLRIRETREITIEAPDREALLVAWLNYLLYLNDIDGFLGRDFDILHLTPERLSAQAKGEIFDPSRHVGKTAVKAATYHHLEIKPQDHGWLATVILDL